MNKNLILRLIFKKFGEYKKSGDEVQVKCPFCVLRRPDHDADHSFKLYINIDKEVYNCFRCEVRGRLDNLFPQLAAIEIATDDIIDKPESILEALPVGKKLNELKYPWSDLVREFFVERNYNHEDFLQYVYFCEDYKKSDYSFGPRLVFPIHQFGSYRGFQARTLYKNTLPKYIGASSMDKRNILYNYDIAFSQMDRLVITEGFFDQIAVGKTAVATLGKSITDNQLHLIRLGDFKKVILFLDKDAEKEAKKSALKLATYFNSYIAKPKWESLSLLPNGKEKKDPGDMSRKEIEDCLQNNIERIY